MTYEHLLAEGKINTMAMRNRIIVGPVEKNMANLDGTITQRYIDYATERAKGGASLIQLEASFIDQGGRGNPFQFGCHDDIVLPALTALADSLHEHGAKLAMQLNHAGRQASANATRRQPIAPSPIKSEAMDGASVPREMTQEDIDRVIALWAAAAERCVKAGVDLIYLHGAHGYMLGQFLSPQSNQRTDKYGGSLERRAQFALEVYAAVRAVVGPDYPIGYRISAEEYRPGGLTLEDSVQFCRILSDAGIDLIDVAGGTYENMDAIFQSPLAPKGGFVAAAVAIKDAVGDTPVSVAQRLKDPDFAEHVLATTNLDFVTLARAFHADPHYVRKLQEDRSRDILPCIGCNSCLDKTIAGGPSDCAANPHSTYETTRRILRAPVSSAVLVAGGGIAGMQAARILARQGHAVTLVESSYRLGGQVQYAREVAPDYGDLADWLERQLLKLRVDVRFNTTVDVEFVKAMRPDAIIVATGARGGRFFNPIDATVPVLSVFEAIDQASKDVSGQVIGFTGADFASCYAAIGLAAGGAEVHMFDPASQFATGKAALTGSILVNQLLAAGNVVLHPESTVESIVGNELRTQCHGERLDLAVDQIVIGGRTADNALTEALIHANVAVPIHSIGDCIRPRDVYFASAEAAEVSELVRLAALERLLPVAV